MDQLLESLTEILGPDNVLTGEAVLERSADWFSSMPCEAAAIVRPATTEQLSQIMALCHKARQPVVTHGGVTGVVHGAVASANELVISLERMTAIEEVDAVGGTMTVQAGIPLQSVQEAAAEIDMQFPLDLGARGSCTIGGNIATNAGGVQVIRYGMMRQQVLGLEAVLADGRVVSSMNRMLKNNAGYDLKQLFIGSEGTLGIVTRAVLRLQPRLPSEQCAMVAVPTFDALTTLLDLTSRRLDLSAFEALWNSHYRLMTEESGAHRAPLPVDSPFYAIIETQGVDREHDAERFQALLEQAFEEGLISDAVLASSEAQRQELWAIRENIEVLIRALDPMFSFDVSLPIPAMASYVADLERQLAQAFPEAGRLVTFGHLGDGNLHIMVTVGDAGRESRYAVEKLVYQPLAEIGGSISAEHGIGMEKRDYLYLSRNEDEIEVMKMLKKALDPKGLLNPGKVLP
ncbi:FAD-binding oxidoreductase [Halomonas marinisediminis]|uniref:FAD-binding oxidoreductase n=1 Tax=Halomonas marinisediminis TaxID=2546095 RepID=A0ABY2DBB3_9GAMM|nr:FAD-binding oxidoreductase [Halomonas marinisediminis]TDB05618.1 FAD-binding oxidoreductase [Halomonas marinisediminis]